MLWSARKLIGLTYSNIVIGQYPDFFSAAVLRNPVITMGEISSSDIPDWYFEESGIPFEPTSLVTSEVYKELWAMSPLSHVDKVRTPTLLSRREATSVEVPEVVLAGDLLIEARGFGLFDEWGF